MNYKNIVWKIISDSNWNPKFYCPHKEGNKNCLDIPNADNSKYVIPISWFLPCSVGIKTKEKTTFYIQNNLRIDLYEENWDNSSGILCQILAMNNGWT